MHPQLLLSSPLSPEQRDIAETILDSGNSLLGILGDILDFSKLDQGEVVLKRQEMCLRGTIEACIEVRRQEMCLRGTIEACIEVRRQEMCLRGDH